jgi:hypothetical protein
MKFSRYLSQKWLPPNYTLPHAECKLYTSPLCLRSRISEIIASHAAFQNKQDGVALITWFHLQPIKERAADIDTQYMWVTRKHLKLNGSNGTRGLSQSPYNALSNSLGHNSNHARTHRTTALRRGKNHGIFSTVHWTTEEQQKNGRKLAQIQFDGPQFLLLVTCPSTQLFSPPLQRSPRSIKASAKKRCNESLLFVLFVLKPEQSFIYTLGAVFHKDVTVVGNNCCWCWKTHNNILRLFAAAACGGKSWNALCWIIMCYKRRPPGWVLSITWNASSIDLLENVTALYGLGPIEWSSTMGMLTGDKITCVTYFYLLRIHFWIRERFVNLKFHF